MTRPSTGFVRAALRYGLPLLVCWLGTGISFDAGAALFWVTGLYTHLITRCPPLEAE